MARVRVRVKSSLVWLGLLLVLLPVLGLLAVLQYRWIGEVSEAERDRLASSLRVSSEQFASDFDAEFSRLANAFQFRGGMPDAADPLVDRYQQWSESDVYPRIVHAIYLLKTHADKAPDLFKVNLETREFEPAAVPEAFANFRERFRLGRSNDPDSSMLVIPIFQTGGAFGGPRGADLRGRRPEGFRGFSDGRGPRPGGALPGPIDGAVVIELDRDVILKDMVPALSQKHFSPHDESAYRVAIVTQNEEDQTLYSSGRWGPDDIARPDASINLFNGPRGAGFGRGRGPGRAALQGAMVSPAWKLLLKHRAGSLENAVAQVRRRDLAISFGILLVLGAGLIALVVSSHRAHTLGKLQMEFAAVVSHELRTPLAVIRSAAHNLRSGIVGDKEGVREYASIVQDEARRLSDMVEEVLLYAETHSGRKKYKLEPVDIVEVIDRAITNLSPAVDLQQCELTTHIDSSLPPARADAGALAQCIQNLLSNAFKYGKRDGKAQIEIIAAKGAGNELRLSVVDRGPGIDGADQRQLFEPFYRGRNVESNIPGNGLGLHLVKRIMQAQAGRVTFDPAPHGGAAFTLHIPAAL